MALERNVGGLDRVMRGVAGIWLVVVAVAAALDERRVTAATAALAGIGLLFNWRTQFCGCNAVFGIDTTEDELAADA
ncbi:YgaP family membrane protein [Natrinema salifodinae]|uniref:Inner membrane protein YgaP-like transmembrane domain-containing protein n=1 Tax=Natrinema salifodinae TaxID=1202768 RepID=A0A1I0LZX5_9EURY|nr:DUF2892 domain-containing protein [Natrinema salifodinae]SEV80728.1 Protein of unknown function [Natrinema salifodinae]